MKKLLFALFLIPSVSWGANIDQPTVQLIQKIAPQVRDTANELLAYANYVNDILSAGGKIEVGFTGQKVDIPQATQDQLLDVGQYKALKVQMTNLLSQLP